MAKNKNGICMADGGITKETPDQLMARMSAKYGAPAAGPVQSAPVQQSAPQPVPKPQAPQQGIAAGIRGMFGNRQQQLDEQERKANGMANGGIVRGKGTPTSDDVPVKIKGEDYNLSDTEAVLPSKTRQALGEMLGAKPGDVAHANKLVEAFIEKTNGKPPVSVNEGVNLANGGLLDEEARRMDYQAVTGVQAPAPTPAPVAQPNSSGWSIGKSGLGSNVQVTTGDAARLPAPVVQEGIATMRGQLASQQAPAVTAAPQSPGEATAKAAEKVVDMSSGPTVSDGAGGVYTPEGGSKPGTGILAGAYNLFADSAKAARTGVPYSQVQAEREASASAAAVPKPANYGNEGRSVPNQITKANPGAVVINDTTQVEQNPMQQSMPLTTKDIVPGGYIDRGAGIIASRNKGGKLAVTNVGTEGIADMSKGIVDGSASALIDQKGSTYNPAAQLERMQRSRMISDLTDPSITDPAVRERAAMAIGIAGRPEDNQLKQAQAQGIMAQTESSKMLADIQKKAMAGDAQAAASYRALTGKSGADYKDRYITLPNRKVYNEMGQVVGEESGGIFDAATGRPVQADAAKQGAAKAQSAPASAVDYLKKNPAQAEAFKAKYGYLPEGF